MCRRFLVLCLSVVISLTAWSQKNAPAKYPSLLWEITGNGLTKPSYLFGTMHVSSKMVFHLSDSFYHAIQHADMVALELNPFYWQRDMMKMNEDQRRISDYTRSPGDNYLTEKSFRLEKYEDNLKAALTEEPTVINGLLYRTFQPQADYEENTYLDLYIYQTGRKLGKKPGGVEDYYQTQQLIFEAYEDMAKDKNKKRPDTDGESMYDIERKLQEAYRKGDLDMLDSLEKFTFNSQAYAEKFLYKRNEIQASSIDTILKHNSLFVGVGAAHLPGPRGVIEMLRKKGYTLRPIIMQDRDAAKKDEIDQLRVPVSFSPVNTADGVVSMQLPGPLYRRNDTRVSNNNGSWQYADMDNGAYYMLTRVKTHAAAWQQSSGDVSRKIDSMLYENIPGKILKKTPIVKNGFPGFDITNRTRRGDLQRYNIIITPFEVLVFKMSGNENYVDGKEAETFFGSIQINTGKKGWQQFATTGGGFNVQLPQYPDVAARYSSDNINKWEYEAVDSANKSVYFIWKKTLNNFQFLEEDTFDLSLIEESVKKSDIIQKQLSRKLVKQDGYDAVDMQFSLKAGGSLQARAILRGAHYYLVGAMAPKNEKINKAFFNSFHFTDFGYGPQKKYVDTLSHFSVTTSEAPSLDSGLMAMTARASSEEFLDQVSTRVNYWPVEKIASFRNDTTGERIIVSVQQYPKYYYKKDSASFWKAALDEKSYKGLLLRSKVPVTQDNCAGYQLEYVDTNTVRKIIVRNLLKDNRLYKITALTDTVRPNSLFIANFLATFEPDKKKMGPSVFENKTDQFFADYYSKDSLTKKKADAAIANIYFLPKDVNNMMKAINSLSYTDKNYFELKNKFIKELGYINDSCCTDQVVKALEEVYNKTADTSYFQNNVLFGLARLKTKSSYALLKNLLLQEPPVFDNTYEYRSLISLLEDSLELTKEMFPDILQLSSLEDYKAPVLSLLSTMVDSSILSAKDYESNYSKLYFDAKIELKKQQSRDEKLLEQQKRREDESNNNNNSYGDYYSSSPRRYYDDDRSGTPLMGKYAKLLMPFYDKNQAVPKVFDRLLKSNDMTVRAGAAVLLLKNGHSVPDSIWTAIAAKDQYRIRLYKRLETIKRLDVFPAAYKTQELLAKSLLLNETGYEKFNDIALLDKQIVKTKDTTGYVYFFQYKLKKDDDWKLGISGVQPLNLKAVNSNDDLVKLTDKKVKEGAELKDQMDEQLHRLLLSGRKSAQRFYEDRGYGALSSLRYNASDNDDGDDEE